MNDDFFIFHLLLFIPHYSCWILRKTAICNFDFS